jgi:signal transduction histidine kinase
VKHPLSISLRLTGWFGAIFLSGWLLFGAAMWLNLKRTLTIERQQTLTRRTDRLEHLLLSNANAPAADRFQDFKDFASATGNGLSEVYSADGSLVWPAPSAAAASFPWPGAVNLHVVRFTRVYSADQPFMVIERPFTDSGRQFVLAAAAPEAGNLALASNFLHGMITLAPVLLIVSMAGGYWTSRRALRPVDRITAAVRSISIRNLSERLPVTRSSDELERLAETCNDMLARLEIAVRKLKQFTADASHELRGPLSLTRTIAEVALRHPATDISSRRALEEIVEESAKATLLLEQMLELARADSEPTNIALEPIDLRDIVTEGCMMASTLASQKGIEVSLAPLPQSVPTVLGNAPSLRRLVWILLDNALKYTQAPGTVRISLVTTVGAAIVSIEDTGIGIAEHDLPHIFDRFYRADPSRGQIEGSGLGLSIAKWIADTHRADLCVSSREGLGSCFTVTFTT